METDTEPAPVRWWLTREACDENAYAVWCGDRPYRNVHQGRVTWYGGPQSHHILRCYPCDMREQMWSLSVLLDPGGCIEIKPVRIERIG